MKGIIKILFASLLLVPTFVFATSVQWDLTGSVLKPIQAAWNAQVKGSYFTATSTTQNNTFPRLVSTSGTSTNFVVTTLCLTGDACRTTWPTAGGGAGNGSISTSTTISLGTLAFFNGLSTIASVATGTLTTTATGLQFDATQGLVGGSAVLSITSGYGIPLTASTTNWQTAYGWGNHASAGYVAQGQTVGTTTSGAVGNIPYWTGIRTLGTVATTSLTASGALSLSNPISVIGGSASALTCLTASGSQAGCLSTTDYTTFTNKAGTASPTFTGNTTLATFTATAGTTTSATSTNLFTTNLFATNFSPTTLTVTNLVATNGTTTNASSTNAFATNKYGTNDFTTNFTATNGTTTNATNTNFYATNFYGGTDNVTNEIITNSTTTNATATRLFATNLFATNFSPTAITATNGTVTNATTTNLSVATAFNFLGTTITNIASWFSTTLNAVSSFVAAGASTWDFGGAASFELPNAASPSISVTGQTAINTGTSSIRFHDGTRAVQLKPEWSWGATFASSSLSYDGGFRTGGTTTVTKAGFKYGVTHTTYYCQTNVGNVTIVVGNGTATSSPLRCTASGATDSTATNGVFKARENMLIAVGSSDGNASTSEIRFDATARWTTD